MAVKVKKKIVKKAKPIAEELQPYLDTIKRRYRLAVDVYAYQDKLTQEVIDRLVDRLQIATTGVININDKPYKLPQEYIDKNCKFLAVDILGDLALMGVRIASFKFHPDYCASCRKKFKTPATGKAIGAKKAKTR